MIAKFCRSGFQSLIGITIAAFALACVLSGCTKASNSQPQNQGSSPAASAASEESSRPGQRNPPAETSPASHEDETVLAVSQAVRKNELVGKPDQCIAYQFDGESSRDYFIVDVRENHRHSECGGDPQTSPRLFTVRVSKSTGEMSTDAKSVPGEFRALPQ